VKLEWQDVWGAAALTSLLFTVGKFFIGFYLGHSGTASTYGAAGALVVMLIWVYYSTQILLFGGEVTKSYKRPRGRPIVAQPPAERFKRMVRVPEVPKSA